MSISTTMHEVRSVAVSKPASLGHIVDRMSYYRVIKVITGGGETFELTLFSPDPDALGLIEEY